MSVAGIRKQFNKATQLVSEKVGGAEGTKLDEDFKDLERRADIRGKAVVEVLTKTSEYLQPNPASRTKLSMLTTVSKIRGQVNSPGYPQPEDLLGDSMTKYGRDMGEETSFGGALLAFGEAMKTVAKVKDSLDIDVKQNFIDPLQAAADKDVKAIQHHLKKLEGRRLDYDYKKKRQGRIPDEEIRLALEKFHESKELAENSMHDMLETDMEHMGQLSAFAESLVQYHRQSLEVMEALHDELSQRMSDAQSRPAHEYAPKAKPSFDHGESKNSNGGHSAAAASPPVHSHAPSFQRVSVRSRQSQPCCKALYDFEPENEGELGFREGDVVTLMSQIDEHWLEGSLRGHVGHFPVNYVDILVPLPH